MIRRLLAQPPLHFVLIGAFLYLAQGMWSSAAERDVAPHRDIVVSAATLSELRESFEQTTARAPSAAEIEDMVRTWADTEILYREALARGLDEGDRSVRWRLIQKMQFLADADAAKGPDDADHEALVREALALGLDRDDLVIRRLLVEKMKLLLKLAAVREPPSEDDLRRYYDETAEAYRQPPRVSLRHVFLSSDRRGERLRADAETLFARVRSAAIAPEAAIALGDVFPLGHEMRGSSEQGLAKLLGAEFARVAMTLPVRSWQGPIASAYGLHLVWVDAAKDSRLPEFDEVRRQVTQRYLAARRDAELDARMAELRRRYAVSIDAGTSAEATGS